MAALLVQIQMLRDHLKAPLRVVASFAGHNPTAPRILLTLENRPQSAFSQHHTADLIANLVPPERKSAPAITQEASPFESNPTAPVLTDIPEEWRFEKCFLSYVPVDGEVTEADASNHLVIMDALLDAFPSKIAAAAKFGARGVLLAVHNSNMLDFFNISRHLKPLPKEDAILSSPGTPSALAFGLATKTPSATTSRAAVPVEVTWDAFSTVDIPVFAMAAKEVDSIKTTMGIAGLQPPAVVADNVRLEKLKVSAAHQSACN